MSEVFIPSTRGIVKQLLKLASDPENHDYIFKETGCISGLVSYLKNADEDIVCMAAQAIQFLTVNRDNRPKILKFADVIPSLTSLTSCSNSKTRDFASASLSNLNAFSETSKKLAEITAAAQEEADAENRRSSVTSSGIKRKTIESFYLAVEELKDPMVHASVERTLIMEKGVTSVTLDKARGQATIFGSATIDIMDLVRAVRSVGAECDTWEAKQKSNPSAAAPGYLDDAAAGGKAAVTSYGFASLEARLNEKALKEEKNKQASRVINKLGGALSAAKNWFW